MSNEIVIPGNKDISLCTKLYLLNLENGRVLDWTAYLSVRKGFIDCTADGQPIDPKAVPGDHPWIQEQTKGLKDRLVAAGADGDTLYQVGRQLTDDGKAKFKALDYERANNLGLEHSKSAAHAGFTIRIQNKIDRMVKAAKLEIQLMVNLAMKKL